MLHGRDVRPALIILALAIGLLAAAANGGENWKLPPARDFPLVGGNWANQRYSALDKIDLSNVKSLGAAWTVHLEDGKPAGSMQATPIVIGGVMFLSSGPGNVFAIDAKTGAIKWKFRSEARVGAMTNRGVVAAEGKVFAGQRDNSLVALDQQTGTLAWRTQLAEPGQGYTAAPPAYFDGLIYIGVAGGEAGVRGQFGAYDARTGKEVWKFWTLPGPGEIGHETWEGESWKHGGGPVWTHPAIDPDLGTVYIAVGNAGPDNDGRDRGGDNLFTASIVALDLKTGAHKWHFQEVHHDVWDYDNSASPVLADVDYGGRLRKALLHAGKTGLMYILDRTNGKPLVGIAEKPVPQEPRMKTARTQPFPVGDSFVPTCPEAGSVVGGLKSSCIFGAYWEEPVVMTPGTQGGLSWAPMTYSPQTRLVYVGGNIINSAYGLRRQVWDDAAQRLKTLDEGGGFFRPAGEPRSGTLTAVNPATNRIVWQKRTRFPMGTGSGFLSTAGGLLLHGESDGKVVAYDIKNGERLWQFQTDAGADAPVATYEVDGQQYVAILSGGNTFQLSARGDSVWAFKLGGKVPEAPPPPEPPLQQPDGGRGRGSSAIEPAETARQPAAAHRKRLLALGDTHTGFTHDSIGHALATIDRLGRDSGLYDTYIRTDSQWITKQQVPAPARNARNLDYFDAVFLFISGEGDWTDQQKRDFVTFVKDDGKGVVAAHTGNAAFYEWPEFGEMIGGYFDNHPWGVFDGNVVVEARDFPAVKHFPSSFRVREEFYELRDKPYSRSTVRVLAHLDPTGLDLSNPNYHRRDQDFPVAMARTYGKGRTFWSVFGHAAETWDNPDVQKMYLEAIKWAMGLTKGDANPRGAGQ